MGPLVTGKGVWRVVRVSPGDPFLIDRTGMPKVATTDVATRTIRLSLEIPPDMLDKVILHEAAHALMWDDGLSDILSAAYDGDALVFVEELLAWFVESHATEIIGSVNALLGRGVCIDGTCMTTRRKERR